MTLAFKMARDKALEAGSKLVKVNASQLSGAALDYAVGCADNCVLWQDPTLDAAWWWVGESQKAVGHAYSPSRRWEQGGPLILREGVSVKLRYSNPDVWDAVIKPEFCTTGRAGSGVTREVIETGDTPLIAAMRAFAVSKNPNGREFEIPNELLEK